MFQVPGRRADSLRTGRYTNFLDTTYLNLDDVEAHRRVVAFMLEHGLVRKTKSGKLYNIGFKLDDQARAGEYGAGFKARITLSDRSN